MIIKNCKVAINNNADTDLYKKMAVIVSVVNTLVIQIWSELINNSFNADTAVTNEFEEVRKKFRNFMKRILTVTNFTAELFLTE